MKAISRLLALSLLFASMSAGAHAGHEHATVTPGRIVAGATLQVAPEATEATAAVDRFSKALTDGDLKAVEAALDPGVLVLESGGAERSRDEYLKEHAKDDAEFLKAAEVILKRRTARAAGDIAWVASESQIRSMKGDTMQTIDSTETMVLQRGPAGWKIVHIHWSSRRAKSGT